MREITILLLVLALNGCTSDIKIEKNTPKISASKYSFQKVWKQVSSDPLKVLPQEEISFGKLYTWSRNIILEDAKRTLEDRSDIREYFDKLAHPNGICLSGVWEIYKENPYSGYFKKSSKALIIARASSAMSETRRGEMRAFGFAGKIFPTMNRYKTNKEHTANFFLIDDLGGTDAEHFTDVALSNEPAVSTTSAVLKNLLYGLKVASAFSSADSNSGMRQVYEISELGMRDKSNTTTPRWMKVEARGGQTVDTEDFRDELMIKSKKSLVFDIFVANKSVDDKKDWKKIGAITFDRSIVSTSCDHRLHFHHPKWRDDLKH